MRGIHKSIDKSVPQHTSFIYRQFQILKFHNISCKVKNVLIDTRKKHAGIISGIHQPYPFYIGGIFR